MAGNDIGGFEAFADELRDLADDVSRSADRVENEAVDAGVEQTAYDVHELAAANAPKDTGELSESGRVRKVAEGVWLVEFTADHSKPQEYGSGPHLIVADDADALRFPGPDGSPMFRDSVDHPGNDPQPYLRPALDAHRDALGENVLDEIDRILDEEL